MYCANSRERFAGEGKNNSGIANKQREIAYFKAEYGLDRIPLSLDAEFCDLKYIITYVMDIIRTYVRSLARHGGRRRPRLSIYARARVWQMLSEGLSHTNIVSALGLEGISICLRLCGNLRDT